MKQFFKIRIEETDTGFTFRFGNRIIHEAPNEYDLRAMMHQELDGVLDGVMAAFLEHERAVKAECASMQRKENDLDRAFLAYMEAHANERVSLGDLAKAIHPHIKAFIIKEARQVLAEMVEEQQP